MINFYSLIKVHPWVNLQSMLEKCLVGNLVTSQSSESNSISSNSGKNDFKGDTKRNSISSQETLTKSAVLKEIPVLDSYQTAETVNIVLYTKCKNLNSDCLIIDKSDEKNSNNIILFVYTANGVYKYALGN